MTAFKEDLSLMEWTPDNYVPLDKENPTEVRKPYISISYAKIQKVDDLINNDDSTTTPSPSTITSTSTPSTKSRRNILEQRKKRRHRKERDKKAKVLKQKVNALLQQL